MLNFNEGKACDAIIRLLEERGKQQRANIRWPEQENSGPGVEMTDMLCYAPTAQGQTDVSAPQDARARTDDVVLHDNRKAFQ